MDRATEILRATERLYTAVSEPERWPLALEAVVDLVRADHAILAVQGSDGATDPFMTGARIEASSITRFSSAEGMHLMAPLFDTVPVGVTARSEFMSDSDFVRTAAYNELIRPIGGFHGIHLRPEGAVSFVANICRPLRADNFDRTDVAALQMLTPHLQTVVELQDRLRMAKRGHAGLVHLLDRLESGVILTDGSARPTMLNDRAKHIVGEADGLTVDSVGLAAATPAATQRLREAIAAMGGDAGIGPRRMRLDRPSHRLPLLLTVFPFWRFDATVPGAGAARVAVFITEPDAPLLIDRAIIAETFGLTRRESEIAVLLAEGLSRDMIARRLALGHGTVREHLRHVFEKTRVRSQPALVALLRGFADHLH